MNMAVWWYVKYHTDSFTHRSHSIKNYTIMTSFHPIPYIADIKKTHNCPTHGIKNYSIAGGSVIFHPNLAFAQKKRRQTERNCPFEALRIGSCCSHLLNPPMGQGYVHFIRLLSKLHQIVSTSAEEAQADTGIGNLRTRLFPILLLMSGPTRGDVLPSHLYKKRATTSVLTITNF